jgi:hypothetical protein
MTPSFKSTIGTDERMTGDVTIARYEHAPGKAMFSLNCPMAYVTVHDVTPKQMRDLAAVLIAMADVIEHPIEQQP